MNPSQRSKQAQNRSKSETKGVFGLESGFDGVDLRWFKMKVCEKFGCLD